MSSTARDLTADAIADLLQRLVSVDASSLADAGKGVVRVLSPGLRPVRRGLHLVGRAVTVEAGDDLMPMLAGLHAAGPGDVLMVHGNPDRAVAGELFASEAQRRGLTGIVIDGLCRDTKTLATMDFPVYAYGSVPHAPGAGTVPVIGIPVVVGGASVHPGDVVLGDDDGLVVATVEEVASVIELAETIQRREVALRAAIVGGESLFDHLNYDEHLAAVQVGRDSRLLFS